MWYNFWSGISLVFLLIAILSLKYGGDDERHAPKPSEYDLLIIEARKELSELCKPYGITIDGREIK